MRKIFLVVCCCTLCVCSVLEAPYMWHSITEHFRIHEFVSFALLIAVTPWIPSLRLWNTVGVLTSPVSDCWQALLYRWLWIPFPGSNRTWYGGLGEQDLVPCQAPSQPAVAPLWRHSKGEVMWGANFIQNYTGKHNIEDSDRPTNLPTNQPTNQPKNQTTCSMEQNPF